eukprot:1338561-Alexandrium_andersonii.AAC.1
MADAVVAAAQVATPFALNMAEQFVPGQAGTPVGRWNAPNPPAAAGASQPGMAGTWMLLFGPPWVAGGPPRTMWVDGERL